MFFIHIKVHRRLIFNFGMMLAVDRVLANSVGYDGAVFKSRRSVDDAFLVLNGFGKRSFYLVDIYHAALYTSGRYYDFDAISHIDKPCILELHFLIDVSASQIEKSVRDGILSNVPGDISSEFNMHIRAFLNSIEKLNSIKKGDVLEFAYLHGSTQILLNSNSVGTGVPGKDFINLLLSVWLGSHPIDNGLKHRLLGFS